MGASQRPIDVVPQGEETPPLHSERGIRAFAGPEWGGARSMFVSAGVGGMRSLGRSEAAPSTTLKGSVIGGVTTDKMFSSGPFTHTQKAGKQKPEGFLGEE